jgi:UDP-glucose 4-epimerase
MSESSANAMSAALKVAVTGATGHLGTVVCRGLLDAGYEVVAIDRKCAEGFPVEPLLGDLLNEQFVYEALDGCDTVVHLGNHPNVLAGPSLPTILAENVRMNANVFWAAVQLGIRRIVFASSVQVMLRSNGARREPPYQIPYLPLDGNAPADPGTNTYALSKEFGERALRLLCAENAELSATVLRFPMLPQASWVTQLQESKLTLPQWTNIGECLTHLFLSDADRVVRKAIKCSTRGYHQYFPAKVIRFVGKSAADLYREYYAHVPLRCPLSELTELVDTTALKDELGFEATEQIVVNLATRER